MTPAECTFVAGHNGGGAHVLAGLLPGRCAAYEARGVTDRKLRSNFTPGSTPWAMRRAQWTALGLTEADLEKPKIAIVNSSSQLASCFSPPGPDRGAAEGGDRRRGRGRVRGPDGGAVRRDHLGRGGRAVHPALAGSDRVRHRGRGRGRAARRHGLPRLVRQDHAGPADGGRAAEHPDDRDRLRLPAVGGVPGRGGRLRGHLPVRRARQRRADDGRRARRDVPLRGDRARRLRRDGHRQLHAPGGRGPGHGAAGHHAGARARARRCGSAVAAAGARIVALVDGGRDGRDRS